MVTCRRTRVLVAWARPVSGWPLPQEEARGGKRSGGGSSGGPGRACPTLIGEEIERARDQEIEKEGSRGRDIIRWIVRLCLMW